MSEVKASDCDCRVLTLEMARNHYKKFGTARPINYYSLQQHDNGGDSGDLANICFDDEICDGDTISLNFIEEFTPNGSLIAVTATPAIPGCTSFIRSSQDSEVCTENWLLEDQPLPRRSQRSTLTAFYLQGLNKDESGQTYPEYRAQVMPNNAISAPNDVYFFVKASDWDGDCPKY